MPSRSRACWWGFFAPHDAPRADGTLQCTVASYTTRRVPAFRQSASLTSVVKLCGELRVAELQVVDDDRRLIGRSPSTARSMRSRPEQAAPEPLPRRTMSLFSSVKANGRMHFVNAPRVRHQRDLGKGSTSPSRAKASPGSTKGAPKAARPAPVTPKPAEPEITVPNIESMAIVSHTDGWALMVDDVDEPAWVVSKKTKAVESAREAAEFHACLLQIHTGTGKLQQELDYTG